MGHILDTAIRCFRVIRVQLSNKHSTADTCKNCVICGKGFKIGTNEAYNIKMKIRPGGISKIFCFCSHAKMAASRKRHFTEEGILEKIFT